MTTLFEKEAPHPLADRLRPQRLADIVGQDHLLGPEGPIGRMVASRQLASMILWGPPGCGKTTIARLLAHGTDLVFEPLSAVFTGGSRRRRARCPGPSLGAFWPPRTPCAGPRPRKRRPRAVRRRGRCRAPRRLSALCRGRHGD